MSKRQRDDANIASIRAVLGGDIPIQTIENLLYRSNNNVEAAVNLYFSGPISQSTPQTQPQPQSNPGPPQSSTSSRSVKDQQGIKYYLGDLVITGTSCLF
jgi:hypothetical protein